MHWRQIPILIKQNNRIIKNICLFCMKNARFVSENVHETIAQIDKFVRVQKIGKINTKTSNSEKTIKFISHVLLKFYFWKIKQNDTRICM